MAFRIWQPKSFQILRLLKKSTQISLHNTYKGSSVNIYKPFTIHANNHLQGITSFNSYFPVHNSTLLSVNGYTFWAQYTNADCYIAPTPLTVPTQIDYILSDNDYKKILHVTLHGIATTDLSFIPWQDMNTQTYFALDKNLQPLQFALRTVIPPSLSNILHFLPYLSTPKAHNTPATYCYDKLHS